MKQKKLWMFAAVATALMITACGDSSQKEQRAKVDQMMEAAHRAKDYEKLLTLSDSLEKAGSLSPVKANAWMKEHMFEKYEKGDLKDTTV